MARISRSRSRTLRVSGTGTVVRTYPPTGTPTETVTTIVGPTTLSEESTQDWVGLPWTDSSFNRRRGMCPSVTLSGTRVKIYRYTTNSIPLSDTPALLMRRPYDHSPFYRSPIATNTLANMAVASMNPNRPDVDILVTAGELRELPSLLRDSFHILRNLPGLINPQNAARANLAASFGVLPLVSDLSKLLKFTQLVDNREKYLRALSSGKGKRIKRRLTTEKWSARVDNLVPWGGNSDESIVTNKCSVIGAMTREYWFSARAKLLDPPSEREIETLSQELVLGVHTIGELESIWNLIPWTWLIDWFSDTGDILAANRGGLKWQWEGLCIMHRTTYQMSLDFPNIRSGFTVTPRYPRGVATHLIRQPAIPSAYPTWTIPYLTGFQTSILSSLLILRL